MMAPPTSPTRVEGMREGESANKKELTKCFLCFGTFPRAQMVLLVCLEQNVGANEDSTAVIADKIWDTSKQLAHAGNPKQSMNGVSHQFRIESFTSNPSASKTSATF